MSTPQEVLSRLRIRVEETRKKLEREEAALALLEDELSGNSSSAGQFVASPATNQSKDHRPSDVVQIDFDGLGVPDVPPRPTLKESVKQMVSAFGGREFTVPHVEKALEQSGNKLKGKSPRARIAMVLKELEEDGLVERTYRGKGGQPHRFQAIDGKL